MLQCALKTFSQLNRIRQALGECDFLPHTKRFNPVDVGQRRFDPRSPEPGVGCFMNNVQGQTGDIRSIQPIQRNDMGSKRGGKMISPLRNQTKSMQVPLYTMVLIRVALTNQIQGGLESSCKEIEPLWPNLTIKLKPTKLAPGKQAETGTDQPGSERSHAHVEDVSHCSIERL